MWMMQQRARRRVARHACISALAVSGWFVAAGACQPQERTQTARTSSTAATGRDAQTDALASSDAERARVMIRENHEEGRVRRPAAPNDRAGARVVDQPRVGRP